MRLFIALLLLGLCSAQHCITTNGVECCGLIIGSFQKDISTLVALKKGFFGNQGINVCFAQVISSIAGYDNLLSGVFDVFQATVDNSMARVLDQGMQLSFIAGSDKAPYSLMANDAFDDVEDLAGTNGLVDSPTTGLITFAKAIFAIEGLPFGNLIPGGSGDNRLLGLSNGMLNNQSTAWAMLTPVWTIPAYYQTRFGGINNVAEMRDYEQLCPAQGDGYTVLSSSLQNTTQRQQLKKFLVGLLEGYKYAKKKSNRKEVISLLRDDTCFSLEVATAFYDIFLKKKNADIGTNRFHVPSHRGLQNLANARVLIGASAQPPADFLIPGPEKMIDLRPLQDAFNELNLGSATHAYFNEPLGRCERHRH